MALGSKKLCPRRVESPLLIKIISPSYFSEVITALRFLQISSIVNFASFSSRDLVLAKIKNRLDLDSKPLTKVEQSHLSNNNQS